MTTIRQVKAPDQVNPGEEHDLEITYTSSGGATATLLVEPSQALTIETKAGGQDIVLKPSAVETKTTVTFRLGPKDTTVEKAEIIVNVPESTASDFTKIVPV